MMVKKFVITGCGRSATTYMSSLLCKIGCSCGHEDFFTAKVSRIDYLLSIMRIKRLDWETPPYGESSWRAVPFLNYLPKGTLIFHQLRHPLEYIRSRQQKGLVGIRLRRLFLQTPPPADSLESFRELDIQTQVNYLARFWIDWNRLVEKNSKDSPYFRYRVDEIDADFVCRFLDRIEFSYDVDVVRQCFDSLPKNVHGGAKKRIQIDVADIEPCLYKEMRQECERYGFRLS